MDLKSPTLVNFIFLFSICNCSKDAFQFAEDTLQKSHGKIIFSAVVFRHGDRYTVGDYPNNPHSEYFKEAGEGLLTPGGKERAFKFGLWTRKRYSFLIDGRPYNSDLLHMISSSSVRVIASAQLFLAGFYPPTSKEEEVWNAEIPWQPIPVYPVQRDDRMITMREYCARYNREVDQVKRSPELLEFLEKHAKTFKHIEEHGQLSIPLDDVIGAVGELSLLYDTLFIQAHLKFKHPDWVREVYPNDVQEFAVMFFRLHTFNDEMRRLKGGPLLSHIINELKEKRDDPQSEKLFQFYTGHDSNIVALLDTLKVWDGILAQYCAALFFELRTLGEKYIVTVSYRNFEKDPLRLLKIPDCSDPCELDDFIKITKSMIPEDWDHECKFSEPDYNSILF